ncbi:MAG: leucyl aminopeptidase family protein [Leptospiraceae bacterium]|nr:leucyl aminopeptidase family protein [Leptospiraceae bacterium]
MPFNTYAMTVGSEPSRPQGGHTLIVALPASGSGKEEAKAGTDLPESLKTLLGSSLKEFEEALERQGFSAGYRKSLAFHNWPFPEASLILAGLGKRSALNSLRLMHAIEAALAHRPEKSANLAVDLSLCPLPSESGIIAASAAISNHLYRSREFNKELPQLEAVYITSVEVAATEPPFLAVAHAMNQATSRAKDLVNMPPNVKRTATLAEEALTLQKKGLQVEIIDDPSWIEENMPCFFTVARASLDFDPPRWIHLTLANPGAQKRVALVGKSVIFDTGGIQVKPGNFMNTMKADMTGGATVLGIIDAMQELSLPNLEIHAFLAATPNLVSESAMLPDSIVDTACGKRVEIRHTDAEGRLTLIDAVTMAEKTNPDVMITLATLTGSASRAVGPHIALMSRHPEERDRLARAGFEAADICQTLDLLEEDFEDIASKLDGADINNTGSESYRGAQTAAAFVLSGVRDDLPVLHLDIAGGDMSKDDKATGIAARAIINYLLDLNRRAGAE